MYSVKGFSVLNFLSHFSLALSGPGQRSVKADLSEQLVYEYKLSTDPTFSAKRQRLVALNFFFYKFFWTLAFIRTTILIIIRI